MPLKYKEWRQKVLERDEHACMMPGCFCNSRARLQVHHIIPWSYDKTMRYITDNGITLCKRSHDAITGKELLFVDLFAAVVEANKNAQTKTSKRIGKSNAKKHPRRLSQSKK